MTNRNEVWAREYFEKATKDRDSNALPGSADDPTILGNLLTENARRWAMTDGRWNRRTAYGSETKGTLGDWTVAYIRETDTGRDLAARLENARNNQARPSRGVKRAVRQNHEALMAELGKWAPADLEKRFAADPELFDAWRAAGFSR